MAQFLYCLDFGALLGLRWSQKFQCLVFFLITRWNVAEVIWAQIGDLYATRASVLQIVDGRSGNYINMFRIHVQRILLVSAIVCPVYCCFFLHYLCFSLHYIGDSLVSYNVHVQQSKQKIKTQTCNYFILAIIICLCFKVSDTSTGQGWVQVHILDTNTTRPNHIQIYCFSRFQMNVQLNKLQCKYWPMFPL